MISKEILEKINRQTIERYNSRLKEFGKVPRALGWDSKRSQSERFKAATQLFNFKDREIYDIGCGFADFYGYLLDNDMGPKSYTGIDINDNLIEIAKYRFPKCKFLVRDILLAPFKKPNCDCAVMFGVLNFRLKALNNYSYAKQMIASAFRIVGEALIVDMLSLYRNEDYAKENFVFYYSPEKIFKFAQSLTPNVTLKHDYAPIPQKEFMLCLRK